MQFHAIIIVLILNICLFVCLGCSPYSRSLHSYVDVNINCEGLPKFDPCLAVKAIEQLGFFCVPQLLWHGGICLSWSSPLLSVWRWSCDYLFFTSKVILKKTCWQLMTYDIYMIRDCLLIKKNGLTRLTLKKNVGIIN